MKSIQKIVAVYLWIGSFLFAYACELHTMDSRAQMKGGQLMAFGSKESTPSFVLTLPLDINSNEQDYLYKEFKKCNTIYVASAAQNTQVS